MRTIQVNLYRYDELSEKAKERAREWYRRASEGDQWWEPVYEDAERIGLKIESFDTGRSEECEGKFIGTAKETAQKILKEHGTVCETYKIAAEFLKARADLEAKDNETGEEFEAFEEMDRQFLKDLCRDYLKILRAELEYIQSDEAITENIETNEYEFDESGRRA